jgi:CRP/FNR family transcriptional regulator
MSKPDLPLLAETVPPLVNETSPLSALIDDPVFGAQRLRIARGGMLHGETDPATDLFFIESGQIRTTHPGPDGASRLVDVLGVHDWCGVAVLAGEATYGVRATAFKESVIWKIPVQRLLAGFEARPDVLAAINRDVARSLIQARDQIHGLIFDDCNKRIIRALIRLSDSAASTPREDGVVLHMTHSELADAVGAARETVSLSLTQLKNQNLLQTGRSQMFFKPEDLRRLCKQ